MATCRLAHCNILVTRPVHQAKSLAKAIEALGGNVILLPTIEIVFEPDNPNLMDALHHFSSENIAIFVSANAVFACKKHMDIIKQSSQIIAIGPGTKKALQENGIRVDHVPAAFNSEGILALPILQNINDKTIILFCGHDSRPLLKNTLHFRRAKVIEAICYQRKLPNKRIQAAFTQLPKQQVDLIISTSKDSLKNLFALCQNNLQNWLQQIPILMSQHMIGTLIQLNPKQPYLCAANPSEQAILATLQTWSRTQV